MPKIKILTAHNVDGLGGVPEGTILEVDEFEARRKIQMGYAELYNDELPPPKGEVVVDESGLKPESERPKARKIKDAE